MNKILETLIEWDCCPLSHIRDKNGKVLYCHWVGKDAEDSDRWLCVEVSQEEIKALKESQKDIVSMFDFKEPIAFTENKEGKIIWRKVIESDWEGLPNENVYINIKE